MGPQNDVNSSVDVSRFVGPCLISKRKFRSRKNSSGVVVVEGRQSAAAAATVASNSNALAGVPLVSYKNRNCVVDQDQDDLPQLSRLVIHTQGAPLILSSQGPPNGRMPHFDYKMLRGEDLMIGMNPPSVGFVPEIPFHSAPCIHVEDSRSDIGSSGDSVCTTPPIASDSLSVTSEESNDKCLPRIIKPRKRRKKDKKSSNGGMELQRNSANYPYPPSKYCQCRHCCDRSPPTPPPSPPSFSMAKSRSSYDLSRWMNGSCYYRDVLMETKFLCRSKSWPQSEMPIPSFLKSQHRYAVIAEHPPQRPWIPLAHPDRTRPTSIFTVMCYNVLCDKYATRQLYGYCPNWALNWEYRRKGILDEIRHYAADIISLQEIETEQFYNFFLPELKHDGYDGIFSPKSRAKTMSESERKYVDGCAIFFRTNKFSLIKEHLIEFNQLAMANAEGSDVMLNRVMPKDNIGLTALLETKEAAWTNGVPNQSQVCQPLLVCTAHIHWDPEFCDVKLIQTMMLLKELRNFINEETQHSFRCNASKSADASMPIVFCGDLNSLPRSGVCELMTKGRISADHEDFKGLGYKDCLQKLGHNDRTNEYTHNLNLASTYSSDIMPYTNYTFDFKGIIDYIFYQKQFMTPLGLLGPLDPDWLKENKIAGCPHPHIPSDHFPLLCELELAPPLNQVISNGVVIRR